MRTELLSLYVRQIQAVAAACLILFVAAELNGCFQRNSPSARNEDRHFSEPSREDLINTVRRYVAAKSYAQTVPETHLVPRTVDRLHSCNQFDVDRDPYAKRIASSLEMLIFSAEIGDSNVI
jgi:hypothetical protein